ncbi:DHA2 family multidrug resistance protein-like MFS transporter [Streptosporangium becharense]|uniref:DHA2 family multidrug resistance protein-like MFS transporter n=1 Tax=Streptosporangium becharense TaxID=1816182 RepID=A0A7W9MJD7_9ACTN|nr:MFS transporter [Streptosporangium becharense]MBB2911616.1 DHA2 family multidrug resistance protein-like MFS transporter [Streptosporangium becharense]MBB5822566.1 DHA2 family multidrug resistance protein-like MFS transporter [Streptosporangium becharense]
MTDNSPAADRRRWAVLAIACLAAALLSIDVTVLHLALPQLAADLGPSAAQILWIGDAYGFALAGLLITMGNVGDRIGRKRLLLIGSVAFGAASALTAYAPTPELLIAARALLGVAGATIMPSTLSIIRNVFTDPGERTAAVGVWSGMGAAGFALGPVVGGLLLDRFWWGSVFLINLPVMAVIVVTGLVVLPESRNPAPGRLDPASVLLSLAGVTSLIYAVKEAASYGPAQPGVLVAAGAGTAALVLFARRQTRLAEPLIDVRLFRRRAFSASVGANLVAIFGMSALSLLFAWYFQLVLGWSPLQAGLAGLPGGLSAAVGGALAAGLISRLGRARTVALGLASAAAAYACYSRIGLDTSYTFLLVPMVVCGMGIGLTFAVTNDTVLACVPKERAGAAAAISETFFELGGALGIAVLGSILTGSYRGALRLPGGLPEEAATAARESLPTAMRAAAALPAELGAGVVAAAREAFVGSVAVTSLSAAGMIAALAAVSLFSLRGVPGVIPEELRAGSHG